MKNKKGFTLIELLAVIVVLAIIAIIAIPVITNVIDKAKKGALKDSAYGILEAGELYLANNLKDGIEDTIEFTCSNGKCISGEETIDYKGQVDEGKMRIYSDSKIELCITNNKNAALKTVDNKEVTISTGECDYNALSYSVTETILNYNSNIKDDWKTWIYLANMNPLKYETIDDIFNNKQLIKFVLTNDSAVSYLLESPTLLDKVKTDANYSSDYAMVLLDTNVLTNDEKKERDLPYYIYNEGTDYTSITGGIVKNPQGSYSGASSYNYNPIFNETNIQLNTYGASGGAQYGSAIMATNKIDFSNYNHVRLIYSFPVAAGGMKITLSIAPTIMAPEAASNQMIFWAYSPMPDPTILSLDVTSVTDSEYVLISSRAADNGSTNTKIHKIWVQ